MSLLNVSSINVLGRALDLLSVRQRLVSENLANIDTPGYHTKDIDFRRELQKAVANEGTALSGVRVQSVPTMTSRPDGNSVSIDRESLLMAQNQLQFQAAVTLLRAEFTRLQLAINGGTNG